MVGEKVRDLLDTQLTAIPGRARPHSIATQVQLHQRTPLKHLLHEYLPVGLLVGTQGRDYYWGRGGVSTIARALMDRSLHISMHLGHVRNMMLSM